MLIGSHKNSMVRGMVPLIAILLVLFGARAHSENVPTKSDAEIQLEWLRKAAEQGDEVAQNWLGRIFFTGEALSKDDAEMVKWLRKAAEQGVAESQLNLGSCYATGRGVPKDDAEAVKWWRKAAEQGDAAAQSNLGIRYATGKGVPKDDAEAVKWYRKAAEQGFAKAQYNLGVCYDTGKGVPKDDAEAVKWWRKAAEQGNAKAQSNLGICYVTGSGVPKDDAEAVKWWRKAAEQGFADAQYNLGIRYATGSGIVKDAVEAYKWGLLAGAQGMNEAKKFMADVEQLMTREQIAEGQKLARSFKARIAQTDGTPSPDSEAADTRPKGAGTGFFITDSGYLITNKHVVKNARQIRLATSSGLITAKVVKVDEANDFALLKAEGKFAALPVSASRAMKLGASVATVGFPNIGMQGFAPKLAKGEIASLSGATDDARYF